MTASGERPRLRPVFTPRARADLEAIWRYGRETWGVRRADDRVRALGRVVDLLADAPELARERPEFDPPVRIHPSGAHLVIYRIEGDALAVIRILGARTDWAAALRATD